MPLVMPACGGVHSGCQGAEQSIFLKATMSMSAIKLAPSQLILFPAFSWPACHTNFPCYCHYVACSLKFSISVKLTSLAGFSLSFRSLVNKMFLICSFKHTLWWLRPYEI